jgi:hypothetical protein
MLWKVLRQIDLFLAMLLGFPGTKTISAECATRPGSFCAWVCWITGKIEPGHCWKAAERERRGGL